MQGVTEGRIVHYVLWNGAHRPAIIVRDWSKEMTVPYEGYVNLMVFTDGTNDANDLEHGRENPFYSDFAKGLVWMTSVYYDGEKKAGTWHWIEPA